MKRRRHTFERDRVEAVDLDVGGLLATLGKLVDGCHHDVGLDVEWLEDAVEIRLRAASRSP